MDFGPVLECKNKVVEIIHKGLDLRWKVNDVQDHMYNWS